MFLKWPRPVQDILCRPRRLICTVWPSCRAVPLSGITKAFEVMLRFAISSRRHRGNSGVAKVSSMASELDWLERFMDSVLDHFPECRDGKKENQSGGLSCPRAPELVSTVSPHSLSSYATWDDLTCSGFSNTYFRNLAHVKRGWIRGRGGPRIVLFPGPGCAGQQPGVSREFEEAPPQGARCDHLAMNPPAWISRTLCERQATHFFAHESFMEGK